MRRHRAPEFGADGGRAGASRDRDQRRRDGSSASPSDPHTSSMEIASTVHDRSTVCLPCRSRRTPPSVTSSGLRSCYAGSAPAQRGALRPRAPSSRQGFEIFSPTADLPHPTSAPVSAGSLLPDEDCCFLARAGRARVRRPTLVVRSRRVEGSRRADPAPSRSCPAIARARSRRRAAPPGPAMARTGRCPADRDRVAACAA